MITYLCIDSSWITGKEKGGKYLNTDAPHRMSCTVSPQVGGNVRGKLLRSCNFI